MSDRDRVSERERQKKREKERERVSEREAFVGFIPVAGGGGGSANANPALVYTGTPSSGTPCSCKHRLTGAHQLSFVFRSPLTGKVDSRRGNTRKVT